MSEKIFSISKRKSIITAGFLVIVTGLLFMNSSYVSAKNVSLPKLAENSNKEPAVDAATLDLIDTYQAKYFTIVKRNNLFLGNDDINAVNNDKKELKKLYSEVKKQITNKEYLKKYKDIEKRYSKCNEITTTGITEFQEKYYNEVDALLNEVYKTVKTKILPEDFKQLTSSEKKWLKDIGAYDKAFDEYLNTVGLGTIRSIIYYDYQTDMRKFRTLLLMLYLK